VSSARDPLARVGIIEKTWTFVKEALPLKVMARTDGKIGEREMVARLPSVQKKIEDRSQDILGYSAMSNRIRRHVDPFQCRIAIKPKDWLEVYEFHKQGEIWMDLGCGKGEFLAGLAGIYPRVFFIGVEVRKRIAEKYFPKHQHLANLILLHGNANLSIPSMMDGHKVQKVFIHFPDPYSHKDRYKKRRIVNEDLVAGLCEILVAGGTVSVKTDDFALFRDMDALLSARLEPRPASKNPSSEVNVLTEWEQECIRKSMPIYFREYRLKSEASSLKSLDQSGPLL
jgi:tRNA (guanine-N7-)-methyltransferase